MFKMVTDLTRAVVGAAVLPLDAAADIVTLGGELTGRPSTYTGRRLRQVGRAIDDAVEGK